MNPRIRKARWIAGAVVFAALPPWIAIQDFTLPQIRAHFATRDSLIRQSREMDSLHQFANSNLFRLVAEIPEASEAWIRTTAAGNSLEITSLKSTTTREEVAFQLALQGTFSHLHRWIRSVELPQPPCRIDRFELATIDPKGGDVTTSLTLTCRIVKSSPR